MANSYNIFIIGIICLYNYIHMLFNNTMNVQGIAVYIGPQEGARILLL